MIIICRNCKGEGFFPRNNLFNKAPYRTWEEECSSCKGTGKEIQSTKVTYSPWKKEDLTKI